eukprot:g1007.t1
MSTSDSRGRYVIWRQTAAGPPATAPAQKPKSATEDCTLRRWDLRSGELLKTFPVLSGEIRCMSLVDDASVVTGDERGNLQVWDLEGGLVQRVLTAHKEGVNCLSQVHAGHFISGGRDGKLMYWRLQDITCLQTVEVAEITAGVWVMGIAALPERSHGSRDDQRKAMSGGRHSVVRFSPQEVAKLTEHPDGETSTFDAPEYRPPPEKLQLAKGLKEPAELDQCLGRSFAGDMQDQMAEFGTSFSMEDTDIIISFQAICTMLAWIDGTLTEDMRAKGLNTRRGSEPERVDLFRVGRLPDAPNAISIGTVWNWVPENATNGTANFNKRSYDVNFERVVTGQDTVDGPPSIRERIKEVADCPGCVGRVLYLQYCDAEIRVISPWTDEELKELETFRDVTDKEVEELVFGPEA